MRRILITIAVLAAVPGCYTVLRHPAPGPADSGDAEVLLDTAPISASAGNCAACHDDIDLDRFHYAEIPLWVPAAGPWAPWYCDPWWVDVVAVPQGTRVTQSRGLTNERPVAGSAGGIGPGIWMPPGIPAGTAVTDAPRMPISRSDPPPPSNAPAAGTHTSDPTPAPHGAAPAPHAGQPASTPKNPPAAHEGEPAPTPKDPPADTAPNQSPPARAAEPAPQPKPETKEPTKQGQGMRNDRPKPSR